MDLVEYAFHLSMVCCVISLILDIISWYIFIYIAFASFWSVPLIVKGAILLFFVLRPGITFLSLLGITVLWLLAWAPVVSAVCTIVYAYAKSTLGALSTLDYVFISLSIVGNVGEGVGFLFYKYIIAPKLYDEWLLVFSAKWPHDVKVPWIQRAQKLSAWRRSIF
jgi:hypothetical protein